MIGYNKPLDIQLELLEDIIKKNDSVSWLLKEAQHLGLKEYYIGAGCITQTVWNYLHGNDLLHGIEDADLIYYDADTSYEAEDQIIAHCQHHFEGFPLRLDIKNQGRVHIWYKDKFGIDIQPHSSCEAAINTWPAAASAIGVRWEGQKLVVYAPFGLNDLFGLIIRPNKNIITEDVYCAKADKWKQKWPELSIIPW